MYGKLFSQMYDGTLGTAGPWQALVTFQQMIVLADKEGVVDMTPQALSRRTTIPLEIIREGILRLEEPDPHSRTPDEGGRRITRLSDERDWGWRIVNYAKYRKIRTDDERREYHREYARKRRASTKVNKSTPVNPNQPIAEAEAYAEAEKSMSPASLGDPRHPVCPQTEIVAAYHELVPTSPEVRIWDDRRRKLLATRWRESADRQSLEWWRKFFSYVSSSDFLTGRSTNGSGRQFTPSLEWMLKPANFIKIIEGNYE